MDVYDFGMIGLGTMGCNLLLNISEHGYSGIGYDINQSKTEDLKTPEGGAPLKGESDLKTFVHQIKTPRKIMMLVPAGNPVDSVIKNVLPFLEKGDILIDGGNSHYTDTERRIESLNESGIHFIGIGISGGEEGARFGPSIMPGGDVNAYKELEPILTAIAAKVEDEPCVAYLGKGAAGHYVKMVHNGIEYAIMQLISECYDLIHRGLGLNNEELHQVFKEWDSGELQSYLLEITARIFEVQDEGTDHDVIDYILDVAEAKGTGEWTSEEGLRLPMPVPTINAAVMMRSLSSLIDERTAADHLYQTKSERIEVDTQEMLGLLKDALYFAIIVSYAEGLSLLSEASRQMNMEIPIPKVTDVWRGGCIIRSAALGLFKKAYEDEHLKNALLDPDIAVILQQKLPSIQKVVSLAAGNNYPSAALMSTLCYFNAFRRRLLPTNLIQAQRDFFGAHTYERTDRKGTFHTEWEEAN